ILYYIFTPFTLLVRQVLNFAAKKYDIVKNLSLLNKHEILVLLEETEYDRNIDPEKRSMIHSIFELGETEVHEIMIPRTDMVCVEENTSLKELTKIIKDKGHTRIPLYRQKVDNILGIIHAKDLLPYLINEKGKQVKLSDLARPAYFVPESKKLYQLLREFQQQKSHMAIVVDEYGGTAGLITLEDVIEEIVGDIQDEYDQEAPLYRKLSENVYLVDAKIDLHELNELLNIELPTEGGFESLAGFILSLIGYLPKEKEVVTWHGYTFTIEKVVRNRIIRVKMQIPSTEVQEQEQKENISAKAEKVD
ncbi:MAG: HlyC/CorC family transporter, partial [Calditrichaeota bacterium]